MKIGLFGGAFNPVHNAHMAVARAAIDTVGLDKLIFIPSGNAPHKKEGSVSRSDRYKMLEAAISNEEKMILSDYELLREEVSYSADTVEYFASIYQGSELYFIIGDDSYNQLHLWHEPERIIKKAVLLVFPREGAEIKPPAIEVKMKKIEISSSDIRKRLKIGKDCTKLLPKGVFDYIIKNNLYTDGR